MRMNVRISPPVRLSRLPVGSSAKISVGIDAIARATATRCCWPPESSLGRCFRRSVEADDVDHRAQPLLVGLGAGERHRQRDVLLGAERREQVEGLEHEADALAAEPGQLTVGQRSEVGVADVDAARRERVEAGEAVHQRALAGAGRAHDRREAAGREADGHVVEGEDLVVAAAVALGGVVGAGGEGDRSGPGGQGLGRGGGREGCHAAHCEARRRRGRWSGPVCPSGGRPYRRRSECLLPSEWLRRSDAGARRHSDGGRSGGAAAARRAGSTSRTTRAGRDAALGRSQTSAPSTWRPSTPPRCG